MAEWLGNGLQNHVQQFDSAWHLDFFSVFMKPILSCLQSFCMAFFISSLILSSCSNDGVISGTEKINVSVTSVSGNEMSFSIAENNYESVTWLVLEKAGQ